MMNLSDRRGFGNILVFVLALAVGALTVVTIFKFNRDNTASLSAPQVLGEDENSGEPQESSKNSLQTRGEDKNKELKIESSDRSEASRSAEIENEVENENEVNIASEDGEDIVNDATFSARSHFPLSINRLTHELTVTTPGGVKVVAILPSQAVANLMANNPKIEVETEATQSGSVSATLSANLEEKDGRLVYRINGHLNKNLLGLFPVSITTTSFVSAENGEVVTEEQDLLAKILNFLSS